MTTGEPDPSTWRRIGIMGGTFDPPHVAHLACAEAVFVELSLDVVLFIPTGNPSFKQGTVVASAKDRLRMVQLACASNPHFVTSDLEVRRGGITYTLETLKELQEAYPDAELFFIAGADSIREIDMWRGASELATLATFVAVSRPGYDLETLREHLELDMPAFNVTFVEMPAIGVSSTLVRERLRAGRSIRYLVPEPVYSYIGERGLYARDMRG
jgi:nicotinate-nucleotide adenylyltransferase